MVTKCARQRIDVRRHANVDVDLAPSKNKQIDFLRRFYTFAASNVGLLGGQGSGHSKCPNLAKLKTNN